MRNICIICVSLLFFGFKPIKERNKDFQVVSASKQTTFGGIAGSPAVTLYRVKIKALRTLTLVADSAYADGRADGFEIVKDSFHNISSLKLKKGKTIEITVEIKTDAEMGGGDYQMKIPGSRIAKSPVANEFGLTLSYFGGKCKYLAIKSVEKKQDIFMP